jgi:hypothetical protein
VPYRAPPGFVGDVSVERFVFTDELVAGERLGQAEVEQLDAPVESELDVGRFQVPVDDSLLVRRLERLRQLPCDLQRILRGEPPAAEPFPERGALDQLQDQQGRTINPLEAVEARDPGMVQRCQQPGFALQP